MTTSVSVSRRALKPESFSNVCWPASEGYVWFSGGQGDLSPIPYYFRSVKQRSLGGGIEREREGGV